MTQYEQIVSRLRWSLHLSTTETMDSVGVKIGKKKHTISKYLSGTHKMTIDVVCNLCGALGVRVAWVVGETKPDTLLEKLADAEVNAGTELTQKMRNSKRIARLPKVEPMPKVIRRDSEQEKLRVQRENVDMSLEQNPEMPDGWHALRNGVLEPVVRLRRTNLRISQHRRT